MVARVNLMSIDGEELSDHGRTYSQTRVDKIVQLELANGLRKQYVKGVKSKFNITWKWLPSSDAATSDGFAGRDTLKDLCMDGNTHTLLLRDAASGDTTSYTVFVDSYNENIVRRDYISGVYFYDIDLELSEQ